MCQNENVIWYLYDLGFDTHVFHWHGNNVVWNENVAGAVPINPGQMTTVTMTPASYGWWYFVCHFNTHLDKGMEANYIVHEAGSCPLPPLKKTLPL
jgi:FtsP/CotA-like multicopper oxidase with cupredoxin domain